MHGILDRWSFNNNNDNNNFIYIALISWAHGALQCKKGENEIIYISQAWNLFTIIILQDLNHTVYKNNDPLSKNCLKRYVFNSFLKPVKDGDLRKSNGSEFHSLGAHTEKALSP